jgi:hypothetical protein
MDVNIQVEKVALFTNARDEKHIREWAAHHLLIGFDYITIFDHNSITPLSSIFSNFDKRVKIIRYNTHPTQNSIKLILMNEALQIARKMRVDWFIYLDADEFIILNNNLRGIKQLLSKYHFADSLALNWLMFGTNNLIKDPDDLILNNYTKSDVTLNRHVKSFVRPFKAVNTINPHFYNITNKNKMYCLNKVLNPRIEPYSFNTTNLNYKQVSAYIAHYRYQSEETYNNRKILLKRDDNGGNHEKFNNKKLHNLHNNNENLYPKLKYSDIVKKFLKQYNCNY